MSSSCNTCNAYFSAFDSWPTVPFSDFDTRPAEFIISLQMAIVSTIPFLLITAFLILYLITRRIKFGSLVLASIVAAFLTELVLKPIFRDPRPPLACITSYGMPSGHATLSGVFIAWAVMAYSHSLLKDINSAILLWLFALNNAYSRIYLNYHTRNQVLAGLFVGIVVSSTIFAFLPLTEKQKKKDESRLMLLPLRQPVQLYY